METASSAGQCRAPEASECPGEDFTRDSRALLCVFSLMRRAKLAGCRTARGACEGLSATVPTISSRGIDIPRPKTMPRQCDENHKISEFSTDSTPNLHLS